MHTKHIALLALGGTVLAVGALALAIATQPPRPEISNQGQVFGWTAVSEGGCRIDTPAMTGAARSISFVKGRSGDRFSISLLEGDFAGQEKWLVLSEETDGARTRRMEFRVRGITGSLLSTAIDEEVAALAIFAHRASLSGSELVLTWRDGAEVGRFTGRAEPGAWSDYAHCLVR